MYFGSKPIQIQPMLRLNLILKKSSKQGKKIQIQPMLRLNTFTAHPPNGKTPYSNTTNVKVKSCINFTLFTFKINSNTTNVKVKCVSNIVMQSLVSCFIQIQPMLRLNVWVLLLYVTSVLYSNTTNVKVKYFQIGYKKGRIRIQIQPMLRLNPGFYNSTNPLSRFKYNQC